MIDRLAERIQTLGAPICVGLDPRLDLIPDCVKKDIYAACGKTPQAAAKVFLAFNKEIIDHICDLVPAVKPQIAFYEQLGADGIRCYIETVAYAKAKGLVVIGDVKRGDIAISAGAYSNGHLGRTNIEGSLFEVYGTDFITVNPYIGFDSIEPFLADCMAYDRGLFVLVKTSNPNSCIQSITAADGRPVYAHVGDLVSEWGRAYIGRSGFSRIGAVVGATYPAEGVALRKAMPHTFFLAPGYGAQGATAQDLRGLFNDEGAGVIINNSRGIIADAVKSGRDFGAAARAAVLEMKKHLAEI